MNWTLYDLVALAEWVSPDTPRVKPINSARYATQRVWEMLCDAGFLIGCGRRNRLLAAQELVHTSHSVAESLDKRDADHIPKH